MHRDKKEQEHPQRRIPALKTDPAKGLTAAQVRERMENGDHNAPVEPPTKTTRQIVLGNVFTYFNMLFFVLAIAVALVQSWQNMSFLLVVFFNLGIGIAQELKAKKTLDHLSILAAPKCRVVRDGEVRPLASARLVRDDIVLFSAGNQICADAVVAEGSCTVNEALVTGESDEIKKETGDRLLSGSFVVNGTCRARLTAVGKASFAAGLTLEAKRSQEVGKTGMMRALSSLVKWIGLAVIPLGILMFCKEYLQLDRTITLAVTSTVGSIIGMIPEGLYLLTSLALLAGTVRLARKKTLVHDMGCIETLARVDTLCVDKTGTITENGMTVDGLQPLCEDRFVEDDIRGILSDFVGAMQADNATMEALKQAFSTDAYRAARQILPFSSEKKYSGVSFDEDETYLLGAPEILLRDRFPDCRKQAEDFAETGSRVLLLAIYDGTLDDPAPTAGIFPLALVLLGNRIRKAAPATFAYFREQGVTVKVISGDNPKTAASAAIKAGIPNADRCVDMRTVQGEAALRRAAETCTVFGRVTPEQKRALILAMKEAGHTVAMTGDGVNDVLALKAADCSVAMASGSDVASRVSQVVLLNSDFSAMPSVVQEGRRVINNIERSAALYLVKNIFAFCLALITLFFTLPYPFSPMQLSLVSALTIGIPSFVLAMEPNERRIKGKFLPNVLYRALPAAMADLVMIIFIILFYLAFDLTDGALSTICTCIMGIVGLWMVDRTCRPYTKIRKLLTVSMAAAFLVSVLFLGELFTLSDLGKPDLLVLVVVALLCKPIFDEFTLVEENIRKLSLRLRPTKKRPSKPQNPELSPPQDEE